MVGPSVFLFLFADDAGTDAKDEFLKELAIHTIMKPHPHVVELIGCCIRDGKSLIIIITIIIIIIN